MDIQSEFYGVYPYSPTVCIWSVHMGILIRTAFYNVQVSKNKNWIAFILKYTNLRM